jgi:hypothetical protein
MQPFRVLIIKLADAVETIERIIDAEDEIKVLSKDRSSGQLFTHLLFGGTLTAF